jgi:hypothetical protein
MVFLRCGVACLLTLAISPGLTGFAGRWRNIDKQTQAITTVEVSIRNNKPFVHLWGACVPKDCDMGESEAVAFGKSAFESLNENAEVLLVRKPSTIIVLGLVGERLHLDMFSEFDAGDKRSNYRIKGEFAKSSVQGNGDLLR